MSPTVSVIIPTYNRRAVLEEAVNSVLAQTYTDYELIVVDDGSTDNTTAYLASLSDRVCVITQENKGVAAARNVGIAAARGRWIALLDSDDMWLPRKLERHMAYLAANPSLRISQTEEIWVRNGVRVNPKHKHKKPKGWVFSKCLALCLISPSCAVIAKDVLVELGGFDEAYIVCEDYELWLRITLHYEVGLLDEALVIKRGGHEDQLSRRFWGMDIPRISAMRGVLPHTAKNSEEQRATIAEILGKSRILAIGSLKHNNDQGLNYALASISAILAEEH